MSTELEALVRALVADPSKLAALSPEAERALVANLRTAVGGVVAPGSSVHPAPSSTGAWTGDDLMTIDEAATVLKVSKRWLYRHAKALPFARKLSRKVLRFSRAGIGRWLTTKRP